MLLAQQDAIVSWFIRIMHHYSNLQLFVVIILYSQNFNSDRFLGSRWPDFHHANLRSSLKPFNIRRNSILPVFLAWKKTRVICAMCRRMQSRWIVFRFFRRWLRLAYVIPLKKRKLFAFLMACRARDLIAQMRSERARTRYIKQKCLANLNVCFLPRKI